MTRLLLAAVALVAAGAGADAAPTRRQKGDLAIQARAILNRHCGACHTGSPAAGQSLLPVLDAAKVRDQAAPVPFVTPGEPDRSLILQLIRDGSMPPGGRPRPTADEVTALADWVQAGAPGYPRAFDDRATLGVMLDDLDAHPADAPFLRYVSLAHLVTDVGPPPNLRAAEQKLARALLAASAKAVAPEPVDDTATLFRLDTRRYGWDARDLFKVDEERPGATAAPSVTPFDLVLLEYPFGFGVPPDDPDAARLNAFVTRAKPVRPVPFVRGDWLADSLVSPDGKPRPLADDLRALDALARWTDDRKGDRPPGPAARAFTGADPLRVPFPGRRDWQTPLSPLGAWYGRDVTPDPAPFTLTAAAYGLAAKPTGTVAVNEPFMLRVTASADVYVVVLVVIGDGVVRVQPLHGGGAQGGLQLKAGKEQVLRPMGANFFQITSLLGGGPTAREHFVLLASTAPITVPTVVSSKNSTPEIWRFLPDQGKAFDPARTVRKVVSLTVTKK